MSLSITLGLSEYAYRQQGGKAIPVVFCPDELTNAHLLTCGGSGTGKSYLMRRLLAAMVDAGLEGDIFDVHEELDGIPGTVAVKYSQATGHGFNPLVLDSDPHTGGVAAQASFLVRMVKELTPAFGAKQEAALRYLLQDTYARAGIFANQPETWTRQEVTEEQRRMLVESGKWDEVLRQFCYPTLDDLLATAKSKIEILTLGGDNEAITLFDAVSRATNKLWAAQRKGQTQDAAKASLQVDKLRSEAIEAYRKALESMTTGRELDDMLKYDSRDVLISVHQRLTILSAAGIFRSNPPPFGDARVRVHQIRDLDDAQQVMFTKLRLRDAFLRRKREGAVNSLRHVLFLDESHKFFTKEPDDIIAIIAREARKFGIGLWCASQQPTDFPEDFLTNVGTTILLGIHPSYWKRSANMLRIDEKTLQWIRPRESISVKMQKAGHGDLRFNAVIVPNPGNAAGQVAMNYCVH